MKRIPLIAFFAYLSLSATAASATAVQDRTVFGIELGAPFSVPACDRSDGAFSDRRCFNNTLINHKAWGASEYFVSIPRAGVPPYVRGELKVSTVNGIVESVEIGTWGMEAQGGALAALTKRYGEPTRTSKKKHNKLRSRFAALFAEWDLDDLSVKLDGVTATIDWGRIVVSTPRYRKLVQDHEKRQAADSPK